MKIHVDMLSPPIPLGKLDIFQAELKKTTTDSHSRKDGLTNTLTNNLSLKKPREVKVNN